jgi:hypothetical protein
MGWLHGDTLQEPVEENPKLKVDGGRTPWPASHVVKPADHQVGNPSLDPYKYHLLPVEIKAIHTTL